MSLSPWVLWSLLGVSLGEARVRTTRGWFWNDQWGGTQVAATQLQAVSHSAPRLASGRRKRRSLLPTPCERSGEVLPGVLESAVAVPPRVEDTAPSAGLVETHRTRQGGHP